MTKLMAIVFIIPAPFAVIANVNTKLGDITLGDVLSFAVLLIMLCVGIAIINEENENSKQKSKEEPKQ